jgi:hypothetical protein
MNQRKRRTPLETYSAVTTAVQIRNPSVCLDRAP